MYKHIKKILILVAILLTMPQTVYASPSDMTILIEGEPVTFSTMTGYPFIDENDRTLVPFRCVLEAFGAEVSWDEEARAAVASYGDQTVRVPIGKKLIHTANETYVTDTEAIIKNGRTYLPIRAVVESFGAKVGWDGEKRAVTVTSEALTSSTYDIIEPYGLGMGEGTVLSRFGEPDLKLPGVYGVEWWVYRNDYEHYIQLGMDQGMLEAILITSDVPGWHYDVHVGMNTEMIVALGESGTFEGINLATIAKPGQYLMKASTSGDYFTLPLYDKDQVDSVLVLGKDNLRATMTDSGSDPSLSTSFEQQVLELTNVFRVENGLAPLRMNAPLSNVARAHSEDMALRNYFSHDNLEGQSPFDRMSDQGISYQMAGENIAAGQRNAMEAVNGWINSSGHRKNMLSAYEELGVGVYLDDDSDRYGTYYTQNFLKD